MYVNDHLKASFLTRGESYLSRIEPYNTISLGSYLNLYEL